MVVDNDSFLSQGHVPKFAFAEDGEEIQKKLILRQK